MSSLKKIILLTITIIFLGCDDKEENSPIDQVATIGTITVDFNHYWGNEKVTSADFNTTRFTNENNDTQTISKLKYLISNLTLHKANGESIKLSDYYLVDLAGLNSNTSITVSDVPVGDYSSVSFTFGFNEDDNIGGVYLDLNSALWNWPSMLGGGYHFMQFEGKYGATGTENPYAYHMGTARVSMDVFEQNYFDVSINGFTMGEETSAEIKMDISEWFKDTYTWDLSVYDTPLMTNYDAQLLMNQNGQTVFSLGEIN
jgi:hypothetical protein